MNRGFVLGAALILLLTLAAFIFWRVHEAAPAAPPPRAPVAKAAGQIETPAALPEERRALAPTGLILGPNLEPVGGLTVLCGEEQALVGPEGTFRFPEATRSRAQPLIVRQGEEEIVRWGSVLTGHEGSRSPPLETTPEVEDANHATALDDDIAVALAPELPERIRWTITLANGGELATDTWIGVGCTLVEEWGNGARVRVQGRTRLPDDAHIQTSLYFDEERTIAAQEGATVKGGLFEAVMFSPKEQAFYSGIYEVRASFSLVLEPFSSIEEWKKARAEIAWDSIQIPEVSRKVFAGHPGESKDQDAEARAYYTRMLDRARRLERSLKMTLSSRVDERRIFQEGKKPRVRNGAEASAWLHRDYLGPDGKLDEPKWRRLMDEEWRPALRALIDEHAKRGPEKYMRASALLTNLLDAILDESYGYSMFVVYPAFDLKAHPNDFYVDEERSGDLVRLEKVVASGFEGLERFRHLGE